MDSDFGTQFDPMLFDEIDQPPPVHILYPRPTMHTFGSGRGGAYYPRNSDSYGSSASSSCSRCYCTCHAFTTSTSKSRKYQNDRYNDKHNDDGGERNVRCRSKQFLGSNFHETFLAVVFIVITWQCLNVSSMKLEQFLRMRSKLKSKTILIT